MVALQPALLGMESNESHMVAGKWNHGGVCLKTLEDDCYSNCVDMWLVSDPSPMKQAEYLYYTVQAEENVCLLH